MKCRCVELGMEIKVFEVGRIYEISIDEWDNYIVILPNGHKYTIYFKSLFDLWFIDIDEEREKKLEELGITE